MPNVIITGCASAGKTTLINQLAQQGFLCHEEVSRIVIREQLNQQSTAVPWLDTPAFCSLVFNQIMKQERCFGEELVFSDRGLPDIIAYLNAFNYPVPQKYYAAVNDFDYANIVFLLEPAEKIFVNDEERQETFEQALFFYQAVKETYQSLGFELLIVPLEQVKKRATMVLEILRQKYMGLQSRFH